MFEKFGANEKEQEVPELKHREGTPDRLMKSMKVFVEMSVKNVDIVGAENLKNIPPDAKVIVVTSHISDIDLPLAAYAVGKNLDIAITTDSFQHHLFQNPISKIGFQIAGKDNFLPIQYDAKTGHGQFKPKDFDAMQEKLDGGKAMVMAGHAPSVEKDPEKVEWHLPNKGTIGAVYLAEISDAIIVPVSVDIQSEKPAGIGADSVMRGIKNMTETLRNKPNARVVIGEPIKLPHIKGIEGFRDLMNGKPAEGRREEFRRLRSSMEEESSKIMEQLAALLPPSKRGVWDDKDDQEMTPPAKTAA